MFVYFLKAVHSFHIIFFTYIFGIAWAITSLQKNFKLLKISAESFWIIFGLILVVFVYLLGAIKPFS